MYGVDFHADDFAASISTSKRIIELLRAGRIDSISVIANMGCFEECMDLLRAGWPSFPKKPLLSVHINLIDGYRLAPLKSGESARSAENGNVSQSATASGEIIRNSWTGIFLRSLLPGRKKSRLRAAFSAEIEAQIQAVRERTKDLTDDSGAPVALRIDGHVHTHMIPLVFDALMDALTRSALLDQVRFIRCSTEPLSMFLLTPGIMGTVSPINIAKNMILHLLSHSSRKKLQRAGIGTGRIFGLAMTGEMDLKRVSILLPKMERYAKKKDAYLEILAHPGRAVSAEISAEYGPDDRKAFLSPKRDVEYEMLMNLPRAGGSANSAITPAASA